jgi:hypothetical protein
MWPPPPPQASALAKLRSSWNPGTVHTFCNVIDCGATARTLKTSVYPVYRSARLARLSLPWIHTKVRLRRV